MEGFFKIQRKFFDHWLWKENRSLSKAEAFLDLLQLAAFAPTKRVIKGSLIELEQGELVASVRYLSVRWTWSKDKAAAFLKMLESDAMIRRRTRHAQTVVTVCNYKRYASPLDMSKDSLKTVNGQGPVSHQDKVEEGKEGEDKKKGASPRLPPVPKSTKGRPLTMKECEEYASSRNHPASDGSFFFDAKESNGWMAGSNRIKDWKASFRTACAQGWLPSMNGKPSTATTIKPLNDL